MHVPGRASRHLRGQGRVVKALGSWPCWIRAPQPHQPPPAPPNARARHVGTTYCPHRLLRQCHHDSARIRGSDLQRQASACARCTPKPKPRSTTTYHHRCMVHTRTQIHQFDLRFYRVVNKKDIPSPQSKCILA